MKYLSVFILLILFAACCSEQKINKTDAPDTVKEKNTVLTKANTEKIINNDPPETIDTAKQEKDSPAQNDTAAAETIDNKDKHYGLVIKRTIPHDDKAYTQGLFYYKGKLYESTGLRGYSSLRIVDPETGNIIKKVDVPSQYFAEGIAIYNDKIYMLTWRAQTCFVYNSETLAQEGSFSYRGEGWGLTNGPDNLIMSNGSNYLQFIDPETFSTVNKIAVTYNGRRVPYINEMEMINGDIYANIYTKDFIARIDANSGEVLDTLDLTGLYDYTIGDPALDVLNGIAWDAENKRVFLTGKLWPLYFEAELVEK